MMTANTILTKFFWIAFAVFLLASISHVAYFFRAFEPQDGSLYWWLVSYAIAISIDITIFLLSLTVAELRQRQINNWIVSSVWVFIVVLAAFSWFINWEYALQFASHMLDKPASGWFVALINPILASCFQALAIAYTWISDKIGQSKIVAQENLHPAQHVAISELPEIACNLPEISEVSSARKTDEEILQFLAENPGRLQKDIAVELQISESRISRIKKREGVK